MNYIQRKKLLCYVSIFIGKKFFRGICQRLDRWSHWNSWWELQIQKSRFCCHGQASQQLTTMPHTWSNLKFIYSHQHIQQDSRNGVDNFPLYMKLKSSVSAVSSVQGERKSSSNILIEALASLEWPQTQGIKICNHVIQSTVMTSINSDHIWQSSD